VLLVLFTVALAGSSVAAADAAQGKLTGDATVGTPLVLTLHVITTVVDGGTSYVGTENDRSGNCNDDSGSVFVGFSGRTFNVVCLTSF
jgi:hypothetical protein